MDTVLRDVCERQTQRLDEAIARNSARVRETEQMQLEFLRLSAQMTEMLSRHDDTLEEHGEKLTAIEKRPSLWLDRIIAASISAIITAVIATLI